MPENAGADNSADINYETEYKKLQRKLNRQNTRHEDLARQLADSEASSRRIESMVEKALDLFSMGDADATRDLGVFRETLASQRTQDDTTAQAQARLSAILSNSDIDIDEDPRLEGARQMISVVNKTGNLDLLDQIEKEVQGVVAGFDDTDGTVDNQIQQAVLTDRREHGRVDTGQTTAPRSERLTYSDIGNLDPNDGVPALREKMNRALDQLGI